MHTNVVVRLNLKGVKMWCTLCLHVFLFYSDDDIVALRPSSRTTINKSINNKI